MASTPPDIGQPTREARTGREDRGQRGNKWWTLVAVCLGTFMLLLDITIVNVALPDIQSALHSSFADLQWVVDAYALTLAAFLLTAGSLADIYGRRLLYLIGLAVFTVRLAAVRLRHQHADAPAVPRLQGIGGAIMFAVSLALLPTPSAARTGASPSGYGARSPGWRWPSGRCRRRADLRPVLAVDLLRERASRRGRRRGTIRSLNRRAPCPPAPTGRFEIFTPALARPGLRPDRVQSAHVH